MSVLASTCTCGHAMVCEYSEKTARSYSVDLQREIMDAHAEYCGGVVTEETYDSLGSFAAGLGSTRFAGDERAEGLLA